MVLKRGLKMLTEGAHGGYDGCRVMLGQAARGKSHPTCTKGEHSATLKCCPNLLQHIDGVSCR